MEPKYCLEEGEMLKPSGRKPCQPQSNATAPRAAGSRGWGGTGHPGRGRMRDNSTCNNLTPRASSSSPAPQAKSHLRWPRTRRTRR